MGCLRIKIIKVKGFQMIPSLYQVFTVPCLSYGVAGYIGDEGRAGMS
jgi:hypothetical protein